MNSTAYQDTPALRAEVIQTCLAMSELGFCIGTWGNISVRLTDDRMLITPSRLDYAHLQAADLVVVDLATGRKLAGERLPSSETALHRAMLNHRPDIAVWVHTHAPHASALACARRSLPVFVEDMAQIIGGTVECTAYVPGGRHEDLAQAACRAIAPDAAAVLLANHGVLTGGSSLSEALIATQVLEKAAGIQLAIGLSNLALIAPAEVVEERHRYLYKYGKE